MESVGEGVTSISIGDHVIPLYIPGKHADALQAVIFVCSVITTNTNLIFVFSLCQSVARANSAYIPVVPTSAVLLGPRKARE